MSEISIFRGAARRSRRGGSLLGPRRRRPRAQASLRLCLRSSLLWTLHRMSPTSLPLWTSLAKISKPRRREPRLPATSFNLFTLEQRKSKGSSNSKSKEELSKEWQRLSVKRKQPYAAGGSVALADAKRYMEQWGWDGDIVSTWRDRYIHASSIVAPRPGLTCVGVAKHGSGASVRLSTVL